MAHWSNPRPLAVLRRARRVRRVLPAPPSGAERRGLAVPQVSAEVVPRLASEPAVAQPAPPVLRDAAASAEHLALPEPLALRAVGQSVEARQEALPRALADEAEAAGQAVAPSATPAPLVARRAPALDCRPWQERPSGKRGAAEEKLVSAPAVQPALTALTVLTALARSSVVLEMPLRVAVVAPEAPGARARQAVPVALPLEALLAAEVRPEMELPASARCRSSVPVSRAA